MGKDFHKHVGKKILMPHPTDPNVLPVELLIKEVKNKQVTLAMIPPDGNLERADNYARDKNKYLLME